MIGKIDGDGGYGEAGVTTGCDDGDGGYGGAGIGIADAMRDDGSGGSVAARAARSGDDACVDDVDVTEAGAATDSSPACTVDFGRSGGSGGGAVVRFARGDLVSRSRGSAIGSGAALSACAIIDRSGIVCSGSIGGFVADRAGAAGGLSVAGSPNIVRVCCRDVERLSSRLFKRSGLGVLPDLPPPVFPAGF
jgi:hypothetical protein